MIKISKKISILVMAAIMVVGMIGLSGLMKLQERMMQQDGYYQDDQSWMLEEMEQISANLKTQEEDLQNQLDAIDQEDNPAEYQQIAYQLISIRSEYEMYQLAIEENIMLIGSETYLSRTLYKISNLKTELATLPPEAERTIEDQTLAEDIEAKLSTCEEILKARSFEKYIELESDAIEADQTMSNDQKVISTEKLELWYKLDPTGGIESSGNDYMIQQTLSEFENIKTSLAEGIDYTGNEGVKPLTPDKYGELENDLAVLLYRAENDMLASQYTSEGLGQAAVSTMVGFGTSMIVLMILILAGGAVSQEIATGSIKSLIIAPVKRWKIFTAKLMSLLTVGIVGLIIHYLLVIILTGIFFGLDTLQPYVFAVSGKAGSLNPFVYLLAGQGVRLLDVIVFMSFALMLSVLTRNTAASVGISMASFFGVSLASELLFILPAAEWIKFLPFNHLSLISKFFPFAEQNYFMENQNETTLVFSLIYITIAVVCMIYTALDSFNRRDIK
jgi:ABC-type transport system involved in multi-copper enzyme maturation permease subunit